MILSATGYVDRHDRRQEEHSGGEDTGEDKHSCTCTWSSFNDLGDWVIPSLVPAAVIPDEQAFCWTHASRSAAFARCCQRTLCFLHQRPSLLKRWSLSTRVSTKETKVFMTGITYTTSTTCMTL